MFGMSMTEIVVILGIALIILGPEKLPKMARTVGKWMREFRRVTSDLRSAIEAEDIRDTVQEQMQRERKRPTPPTDPYKRAAAEDRALREGHAEDDDRFDMYKGAAVAVGVGAASTPLEPVPMHDPDDPYARDDDDDDAPYVARPWDYGPAGAIAAEHDDEEDAITAVPLPDAAWPLALEPTRLPAVPVALLGAITAVPLRGGLLRAAHLE